MSEFERLWNKFEREFMNMFPTEYDYPFEKHKSIERQDTPQKKPFTPLPVDDKLVIQEVRKENQEVKLEKSKSKAPKKKPKKVHNTSIDPAMESI